MSDNKINLSLDEIIKTGKKNGRGGGRGTFPKKDGAIVQRKQANQARRNKMRQKLQTAVSSRGQGRGGRNNRGRGGRMNRNAPLSIGATNKLVQNLVKKALTQRRQQARIIQRPAVRRGSLRSRGGIQARVGLGSGNLRGSVKSRLTLNQKSNRSAVFNDRRGLNLTTAKNSSRGFGGRMASDVIVSAMRAHRIQQQTIRRQRGLSTRGRGRGRIQGRGRLSRASIDPIVQYVRVQKPTFRGRRGVSLNRNISSPGFRSNTEPIRGVRKSFSHSQTNRTLDDRFSSATRGVKQIRGRRNAGNRQFYF